MQSFSELREVSNKAGVEFLLAELDTASTFLAVAETTSSAETKERNRNNACTAYATALRLHGSVIMLPEQRSEFESKLAALKHSLVELGLTL